MHVRKWEWEYITKSIKKKIYLQYKWIKSKANKLNRFIVSNTYDDHK